MRSIQNASVRPMSRVEVVLVLEELDRDVTHEELDSLLVSYCRRYPADWSRTTQAVHDSSVQEAVPVVCVDLPVPEGWHPSLGWARQREVRESAVGSREDQREGSQASACARSLLRKF